MDTDAEQANAEIGLEMLQVENESDVAISDLGGDEETALVTGVLDNEPHYIIVTPEDGFVSGVSSGNTTEACIRQFLF